MGTLYKIDESGHGEISWINEETIETARKLFNELKASGFMGTETFPGTNKPAKQLNSFDESAEHIVMIPPRTGG